MPLFTWGANSYGQLGLGHCDDAWLPTNVESLPFDITAVAGGGGHSVIVGGNGRVAVCGNNSKGQLGVELSIKKILTFTEIQLNLPSPTVDVSCGWEHTLIRTKDGHVYGLGCNGYGQLALDGQQAASSKPVLIPDIQDIEKTAAGLRHSVALSRDGQVYCWGDGRRGQLGRKMGERWKPTVVKDIPDRVVEVVAGQHHSAALTERGSVYVWGCNKFGQLGVDAAKVVSSYLPMRISSLPEDIIALHSGWSHLIACTSDGHLYGWGRSNYGQIGASPSKFTTIGFSDNAIMLDDFQCFILDSHPLVGCGSEHNFGLDITDGVLRSWGWNEHGMCGLGFGSEDIIYKPKALPGSSGAIQKIACGAGHSLVLALPEHDL